MTHAPHWLTILNRASEHRRDVALLRLGQSIAEADRLRCAEQNLTSQLVADSSTKVPRVDSNKLNLERLHLHREHRNELLSSLSDLKLRQERNEVTIAQQRDTVQQHTSESRKLERLSERLTAQQAAACKQTDRRMTLEELACFGEPERVSPRPRTDPSLSVG